MQYILENNCIFGPTTHITFQPLNKALYVTAELLVQQHEDTFSQV